MSDDDFQTVQGTEKINFYKKLAAPLAVASVCGAAALLFAGVKTASPSPSSTELVTWLGPHTNLYEKCSTSWNRLWEENHLNFIGSQNMKKHMVNGKYHDPSFPAEDSSLFWKMQDGNSAGSQVTTYEKVVGQQKGVKWVRPTELGPIGRNDWVNLGSFKPSLFGTKGIQIRTSEQGNLGDCWFLSSATAVAETPGRLEEVFNGVTEYSDNGAFQMNFYVRGEKVGVHIDDRIPFVWYGTGYNSDFSWINNRVSQDGAWWLVLLEKAMSKLNVNYSNINSGRAGQALRALTNAPVVNYSSGDAEWTDDELWKKITEGMNRNYAMVGGTGAHPAYHVTDGHAETCLGTLILYNDDGSEHVKLVKMRNPWGIYQYDGPWSSKSDLWTPEFKKQADFGTANHGIFYTPLSVWRSEYEDLAIAHTQPWEVASIEGDVSVFESAKQKHEWITFYNPVEQDVIIECLQFTDRLWPNTKGDVCNTEKDYPISYQAYIYNGRDNTRTEMTPLYPKNNIECDGGTYRLDNLAQGYYNVGVWKFGGSDVGHGTWKMRSFGERATVSWEYRKALTTREQQ